MNTKPLSHIRVLDFTNVLAGPYCSMLLANMGAEIIKVEKPIAGDDSRAFGPHINGESVYFVSVNRGKKSIVCDTKSEEGRGIFLKLIKKVDVLVENLKPGSMKRMGLSYEDLNKINPRLVYAAIYGFGHSGPYSPRPSYDMIVQAMGGIISITGQPGGQPVRVGTSIGDIVAGMYAAYGILAALINREKTGLGIKVDVAMFDCQIAILENAIVKYSATGINPKPLGMTHPSITPFSSFETSDSQIIIACGNDRLFRNLCIVLDIDELTEDPRFLSNGARNTNVDALTEIIQQRVKNKTTAEWLDIFIQNEIPCSPINSISDLFNDPQLKARNMLIEVKQPKVGKIHVSGNPIKLSNINPDEEIPLAPAPALGEHTREILIELAGYSAQEADKYATKYLFS